MDKKEPVNKRVSIVIPVYNSHKTLPKCLDSMIAQTYQDLEIICVNDCSKDNSLDIIKEYQQRDSRIKLVNHAENMNAGGARNSGIKAATGYYVCFVDNDDWMTPDAIELLINESEDCTIDFVAPDWCEWYCENRITNHSNFELGFSKEDSCEYALRNGYRMLGCLIRRSIFFEYSLLYPEKSFWEDNAIGMAILYSANQIKAVKQCLYYYYVSPGSSSRSFSLKKTNDRIMTTRLAYENLSRLGYITKQNRQLINYHILCLSYFTIRMLAMDASKEAKVLLGEVINITSNKVFNPELLLRHPCYFCTLLLPRTSFCFWKVAYKTKINLHN